MPYSPQYTRPVKGNFDPDKAFSQVRAGTGAYWMEDEINEMQVILREQNRDTARRLISGGVLQPLTAKADTKRSDTLKIGPFEAVLEGIAVTVKGINTTGTVRSGTDGEDNLIKLGAKPSTANRTDLVLLEVYEEEVKKGDILYKHGAQNSDYRLTNNLQDSRIGAETARRVQVKSVIRVIEDNTSDWKKDLTGSPYTEIVPGLFRSATGRVMLKLLSISRTPTETSLASVVDTAPRAALKVTMFPDNSISADKLVKESITYDKLAGDTLQVLKPYEHLTVPFGGATENAFVPILRYFGWYTMSSPIPFHLTRKTAKAWGDSLMTPSGTGWMFFEGVAQMPATQALWFDKNVQLSSYNGPYYSDNVSVFCVQNITASTQSFSTNLKYSGNAQQDASAAASYAYLIFNPDEKPNLASNGFSAAWTSSVSETNEEVITVEGVPAGHVMIFVLKTSPKFAVSSGSMYWYHNYHGFSHRENGRDFFKPHLPTYHRLFTGVWQ